MTLSFNFIDIETIGASCIPDSALELDLALPASALQSSKATKIYNRCSNRPASAPAPLSSSKSVAASKSSEIDEIIKKQFIALFQTFPKDKYAHSTQTMFVEAVSSKYNRHRNRMLEIFQNANRSLLINSHKIELDKAIEKKFLELYAVKCQQLEKSKMQDPKRTVRNQKIVQALNHLKTSQSGRSDTYYYKTIGAQFKLSHAAIKLIAEKPKIEIEQPKALLNHRIETEFKSVPRCKKREILKEEEDFKKPKKRCRS